MKSPNELKPLYDESIQTIEEELPFMSKDVEVIKEYVTSLERQNKGLKTTLEHKEYDLAHYKGFLTK